MFQCQLKSRPGFCRGKMPLVKSTTLGIEGNRCNMKNKIIIIIVAVACLAILLFGYTLFSGSGELDGLWLRDDSGLMTIQGVPVRGVFLYEFSGRNFTYWVVLDGPREPRDRVRVGEGTFSITDDRIEFIRDGGRPDVMRFSRTENTLTLSSPSPGFGGR